MPRFNNDYYARLVNQQSQYLEVAVDMQTDDYYDSPMMDEEEIADALDWAEEMTQRDMIKLGRAGHIWVTDEDGSQSYTDEAQNLFNYYYD